MARTARPDQQADQGVAPSQHQQEPAQRSAAGAFADYDRQADALAIAVDAVVGTGPRPDVAQDAGHVQRFVDRPAVDRSQYVARPHSHQCGRAVWRDAGGRHSGLRVRPHDPVLRHPEAAPLRPVHERERAERHREDDAERQPPRQFTGPNHVNLRRNSQYREARLECPHYRGCSLRIQAGCGS